MKPNFLLSNFKLLLLTVLFSNVLFLPIAAQINFTTSGLSGVVITNPTSLQFGPDSKLYVSQQNGIIKVLTVNRTGPNQYVVTATQTISLINLIPNHNDNGAVNSSITTRQVTGILVAGTAANPVIYVTSSDSRIGGGSSGSDTNLDTNSGILSMLTWNGTSWVKMDLVRGLPRSEENHSPNGIQLDPATNTLYMSVGGFTNAGGPSNNFGFICEYALSAAIISIKLNEINALPTQGSGNNEYKYDLPTLDDPTRSNVNGADVNDPFGGNDGLNQAKIVPGGPVQIFSPGYRNAYDFLISKTPGKAGNMYTIDNGANQGWGGYPENEGTSNVTNNYVVGEPGSTGPGVNEAQVNNLDGFHYLGNLSSYVPGSYYAGHPNPTRANPNGAGLYTRSGSTGIFRTQTTGTDPLPSDWPPVTTSNVVEGDFKMPGTSASSAKLTWTSSTNGLAEYTASNFSNALKGDLFAASYNGAIYRIKLSTNGTDVLNTKSASTKTNQDPPFASGFGSIPLDIICQGDGDIFPGTIWAATYGANAITIFEPADMGACTGQYNNQDDDNDQYTNADEIDNGTDPCNSSSQPADFDLDFISDKNDPDDDNDNTPDATDVFQIDAQNGLLTNIPIDYELLNNDPNTGFFGLGFTGLMNNKQAGNNYLNSFNPDNLVAGGAVGAFTIVDVPAKDALGTLNNQENGFQFGVRSGFKSFTIQSRMLGPFFSNQTPTGSQSQGIYFGLGDQSNYVKITLNANGGAGGIQIVRENADVPVTNQYAISGGIPSTSLDLYLSVNPSTGIIQPKYAVNGGTLINAGPQIQVSGALLTALQNGGVIAVGIISTSIGGSTFTATWDNITITEDPVNTTWTQVASSGTGKWVGVSVMINNKMYVFSGFDSPQVTTSPKCEVYDPATNTWSYIADMPFPVTHAGITVDGTKVYVSGGFLEGQSGGANTDKLQIYDVVTNTWTTGPSLPQICGGNGLVRVGRKLHSFGGVLTDRQTGNPAHYVLDLDNMGAGWSTAAPVPYPLCHIATAHVEGKIYIFGGQKGHDGTISDEKQVWMYNLITDTWTRLNDMPYIRSHSEPGTFVMEGKVYLVGGRSGSFSNVLDKVTYYNPATDTWTEDVPLPAGVTLFGPAAEAIGNKLIVSNGSLNQCCDPQKITRIRDIARTPSLKMGFFPGTLNLTTTPGNTVSKKVILWTHNGAPSYTISTAGFPSWLNVFPLSGTVDLLGGTEISIVANASSLTDGNYNATVTAKSPGYTDAVINISFTVSAANNNKVLYVYGSVPPGEVDMKLTDNGSTGMSQFNQALIDAGFQTTQAHDAAITLNATLLNQYKVLILGSNNRRFSSSETTAVNTWVNAGGGIVAWSDAAFGWAEGGLNSTNGLLSDNDLTQQFGMQFLRDNGAPSFTYNQFTLDHFLNRFNKNGGITIKAEGVSPIRTSASATIVGDLPAGMNLNNLDGAKTAADAALSVALVGQGRVVGYFDRNAFWNAGAGTNINEVDNREFAQRLVLWAAGDNSVPPPPPANAVYRINAGGSQVSTSIGVFAADNYFSPSPGYTYSNGSAINNTTDDVLYQSERAAHTNPGSFNYNFPVSNGTYTVILHFAEIYHTTTGKRVFDVSIEGSKVLDNFDIVSAVGAYTATTRTFNTNVTDGMLNIYFSSLAVDGGVSRPKVSAIEILSSTTTNQPPVANAGNDITITLPTNSVGLAGTGNDPDGSITSYAWTKISGPSSFTIQNPNSASTQVSGLVQGSYVFRLTVTDNGNPQATGFDDVTITVNSATTNQPPTANAGQDQTITLPENSITLNGSGNDPDGSITSYAWSKISGPSSFNIQSPNSASTQVTGLVEGSYVFRLTVTDNASTPATGSDDVMVTVNSNTLVAVYRINAGGPQLSTSMGVFDIDNYFSPSPGYTYSASSSTSINNTTDDALYQTERAGQTNPGTINYNFPIANGTYTVKLHFAEIYYTTTGKRVFDVSIEGIKVLDNFDIVAATGAFTAITHTFNATVSDGVLNIYLSSLASDGGKSRPKISAIEILGATQINTPPTADAGPDQNITLPTNSVTLTGNASDIDGTVISYSWSQISGPSIATIANPNNISTLVSNLQAGVYVFRFTVTDNDEAIAEDDVLVNVINNSINTPVYRINAGGPGVNTSIGFFAADNYYSQNPVFVYSTSSAIGATNDDIIYQTERSGNTNPGTLDYNFPVSNGTYTVILHFADIYYTSPGKRIFDVMLEGNLVLDNFDIAAKVGGYTATTESFTVNVNDGTLNIHFSSLALDGGISRPKISAIEILTAAAPITRTSNVLEEENIHASVFPNPSSDGIFNVKLAGDMQGIIEYKLLSVTGTTVAQGNISSNQGQGVLKFDFSKHVMQKGMYFLELKQKNKRHLFKLIKLDK